MHIPFELWLLRLHSDAKERGMLQSVLNTSHYVLQRFYDDEVEPTISGILGYDDPQSTSPAYKSIALPVSQVIQ